MGQLPQNLAVALNFQPISAGGADFVFDIDLHGFRVGDAVRLAFIESDATDSKSVREDCVLGTVSGKIANGVRGGLPALTFLPDAPVPAPPPDALKVGFRFAQPMEAGGSSSEEPMCVFALTGDRLDSQEGDWWELLIREELKNVVSQPLPLARIRRQLEDKTKVTYDWHDGNDVQFYHDGSTDEHGHAGAFKDILNAIEQANHFIFVVDWSFQPLFRPGRVAPATQDDSIGARLIAKAHANKNMLVAIHTWDHTHVGAKDTANDDGDDGLKWIAEGAKLKGRPENLLWRASSRTGVGWSHHQKFVVLDAPVPNATDGRRELKVFFGGLDLTKGRFDWPLHVVSSSDIKSWPFKQTWSTANNKLTANDWYNNEFGDDLSLPRQPWHDIYGQLTGPTAWDFVREFVGRWMRDPSLSDAMGDDGSGDMERVWTLYQTLRTNRKTFVQQYEKRGGLFSAQVYRSLEKAHWSAPDRSPKDDAEKKLFNELDWKVSGSFEMSIQHAYRQAIDQAEDFIYIENQYLVGSGNKWGYSKDAIKNDLPERIVNRIIARAKEHKPFHVYVVIPMFPEGDPVGKAGRQVRKNEWKTIEYMITTLDAALGGESWSDRLSFYFLANWPRRTTFTAGDRKERVRAHDRYMVYVHSKMMIVDDRFLIFGSANLNERSLAGDRDTEIACGIWPTWGHEQEGTKAIREFRQAIWEEHFGMKLAGSESPGSSGCITAALDAGDANYIALRTMSEKAKGHICRWPFQLNGSNQLLVQALGMFAMPELEMTLPDAPNNDDEWMWSSNGAWFTFDLAE